MNVKHISRMAKEFKYSSERFARKYKLNYSIDNIYAKYLRSNLVIPVDNRL